MGYSNATPCEVCGALRRVGEGRTKNGKVYCKKCAEKRGIPLMKKFTIRIPDSVTRAEIHIRGDK